MCESEKPGHDPLDAGAPNQELTDAGRREALRRLARYSAYTAPALLAVLQSEKAAAFTF